ncbi:MAG: TonB-dependent receptor [Bacteroidota bacterium]
MKKSYICLLFLLLPFSMVVGQTDVTVTVRSADDNMPLVGASVFLKSTQNGGYTDENGSVTLSIDGSEATIIADMIGFISKEIPWAGTSTVEILMTNTIKLEEVVVVGYGVQKKSDVTGSVVSVSRDRLESVPNTNFVQALQGAIPGINISQNSAGAEGNNNSIVIRGRNSISAGNGPLIIVDGIPYGNNIAEINPTDIESIEVLKDASSAAIYGSRGSNGVILITTKRGSGKPKITYAGYAGIQEIANQPDLMNGAEFYAFKEFREPGSITTTEQENFDLGNSTNWIDLATRQGFQQQHTLSVSGKVNETSFYISGSYLGVEGIAVNDQLERYSVRVNLEQGLSNWISIGTNTQLSLTDRSGIPASFSDAFYMNPLTNPYDEEGNLSVIPWPEDPFFSNPLQNTLAIDDDESYKVFSNNFLQLDFPFLKGLSYRLNTGVEFQQRKQGTYFGRNTQRGQQRQGEAISRNREYVNLIVENLLYYNRDFGKHAVGFTGLWSFQSNNFEDHEFTGTGFPLDNLTYFQMGTAGLITSDQVATEANIESQMARLNYSYDGKYLLTLTGRRDGYSGFGENRKYSFFPSVALGWNIFRESFMEGVDWLSNLKLRFSYGRNGNQAIAPYQTLARLIDAPYLNGTATDAGFRPSQLANPELGWETTTTGNIGIDFGLFNGRIQGTFDYYQAETEDLLLERSISSVHGISEITQNIGATENRGLEFGLQATPIQGNDFQWSLQGNFSLNRNEIVALVTDSTDDVANQWFIGQPIDVNFDLQFDGVWQEGDNIAESAQPNDQPGFARVRDVDGNNRIDAEDRTFIGSLQPDFIWGMTNTFSYKGFTLSVFVHGVQGVTRENPLVRDDVWVEVRRNSLRRDYWTPENPINGFWANNIFANNEGVDVYEDASFIRLKDVTLSYAFSDAVLSKLNVEGLSVYVNARNLATITNWTGLDPELSSQRAIPLQRVFIGGVKLQF